MDDDDYKDEENDGDDYNYNKNKWDRAESKTATRR
jgi:hypothetical protein